MRNMPIETALSTVVGTPIAYSRP